MNAKLTNLNSWANELFDLLDEVSKPIATSFHVSSLPATSVNTSYTVSTVSTGGSGIPWSVTSGAGGYVCTQPAVWYEPVTKYVTDCGTPWDNVSGFPPVRVELNKDTKSLRFTWALSMVQKDLVDLEFDEDVMVLSIKKAEKKEKEKDDKWAVLKNSIKEKTHGEYKYSIPQKRYDVSKADAHWEGDLLIAEIPVREEVKPSKVKITK